jgi:transposase
VDEAKPFDIPKREVWEAFKKVKANQGAAGVDGQSIADFEAELSNNLYNRLSSGSYFPPPVNFGLKVGVVGAAKFETRIRELVAKYPDLAIIVDPLLVARRVPREQLGILHRQLLLVVHHDEVCRRLMTMPGVGPVVALTFRATIDVPVRFINSKAVGAALGLTPRRYQSGEIDRMGGISKCGDAMLRTMLFEAAQPMLTRTIKWSWLKAWGMKIAQRRGMKRAIVAVARRMAVIMHRMWVSGTDFQWTRQSIAPA